MVIILVEGKQLICFAVGAAALITFSPVSSQDCTVISTIQTKMQSTIQASQDIKTTTYAHFETFRKCEATLQVKIGGRWYNARGKYIYPPEISEKNACNKAVDNAKKNTVQMVSSETLISKQTMKCADKKTSQNPPRGPGGVDLKGRRFVQINDLYELPWRED